MEHFHFIRPLWLLALLPLLAATWLMFKQGSLSRSWQSVIDPALLPHLLSRQLESKRGRMTVSLFFIGALAAILSLAGPTWKKLPQPVFKQQSALVIALDLSRSMDATDIKPSRLSRVRLKISDLLKLRKEGQTALIVYAANAFTVTPLTDDTQTIASLLSSLTTDIMPAQGSHGEQAIAKAEELFRNAGIPRGDILLVTDGADPSAQSAVEKAVKDGYRVSVLAVGTAEGAPIPLANGGFLKDASGSIVIPKLNTAALSQLAKEGHGRFSIISADDSDIQTINQLMTANRFKEKLSASELKTDQWQEQGHWLLLIVIPLALLAFRRGYLTLLIFFILPLPQPAHALSWDELWLNDNQRAAQALKNNQAKQAAELFKDPNWKASAEYRAGQYEQAMKDFAKNKTAEGFYNQGNALAKSGKLDEAIKAYDKALKLDPEHKDAKYNKELLEKQKQQQQKQQNKSGKQSDKNNKQNSAQQQQQKNQQGGKQSQKNQQNKQGGASQKQDKNNSGQQQQQSASGSDKQQDKQSAQQSGKKSDQQNKASSEQNAKQKSAEKSSGQQDQQQASRQKQSEQQKKQQQARQAAAQAEKAAQEKQKNAQKTEQAKASPDDKAPSLSEQAAKQWLRRIPDDPGGLLRNKFRYQYNRQGYQSDEQQDW